MRYQKPKALDALIKMLRYSVKKNRCKSKLISEGQTLESLHVDYFSELNLMKTAPKLKSKV